MATLTQLANQFNSDKGDQVRCCHRYTTLYEKIFEPFRDQAISILEIGLQRETTQHQLDCPSLRMWLEFFPQARISGFDLTDFSEVDIPRAKTFQGDQSDANRLREVAEEAGPFDIIIDDGSHASAHQQITLGTLWPYLNPGGLFVIEDAHWQPQRDVERRDGIETMLSIFKRFSLYGEPIESPYISDERCREIEQNVVRCTFSHPFVDEKARPQKRSMIRDIARRVLKGKRRYSDQRLFKLIILEKKGTADTSGFETAAVQMTCDAV
ncbi:hypothetical protein [Novipirellula rosea]|uniref:Mycinamicin VI 2''-O-methyltransferase n=1 Tax=Novipirellula rosea TaxID=1031540 RepID=A0ABP8MJP0_9BACT|tara:strand:- start:10904 stop:11707 length:804 start_codon:yes stop_codon:yes gene_type:complete